MLFNCVGCIALVNVKDALKTASKETVVELVRQAYLLEGLRKIIER
jgi:hypothetical protein